MQSKNSQIDNQTTGIPEGFVEVMGTNSKTYLVPEFYAPALHNTLDGMEEKKKMKIEKAEGTVSLSFLYPTVADHNVMIYDGPNHYFARPLGPHSFPSLTLRVRFVNFIVHTLV
jgi:hypothetical protein